MRISLFSWHKALDKSFPTRSCQNRSCSSYACLRWSLFTTGRCPPRTPATTAAVTTAIFCRARACPAGQACPGPADQNTKADLAGVSVRPAAAVRENCPRQTRRALGPRSGRGRCRRSRALLASATRGNRRAVWQVPAAPADADSMAVGSSAATYSMALSRTHWHGAAKRTVGRSRF